MHTETVQRECPYCGELIELVIDCSVAQQQYIEDCFVCCRPITVTAHYDNELTVVLSHENEVI